MLLYSNLRSDDTLSLVPRGKPEASVTPRNSFLRNGTCRLPAVFLLRHYHRAASNRKICFVQRMMNGSRRKREKERERVKGERNRKRAVFARARRRALADCKGNRKKAFGATEMENLAGGALAARGRDHNLYNGLAKVYPESRFSARKRDGERNRREQTLSVRSYGRCIIIAPTISSRSSPPHTPAHSTRPLPSPHPTAFYSQCTRIRVCTIANKAIRCAA